jgi:PIN domain
LKQFDWALDGMIKICLDTNTFQDNWIANGEAFTLLGEFIAKGVCETYISEVSILEHVRHYEREAPRIESKLKPELGSYAKVFGFKPPSLPTPFDAAAFEKYFRKRLSELGIKILAIPPVSHADLVARDLAEKKPFAASGKGYRDALIWLSFLEVLDGTTTRAVLVTNNTSDFATRTNPGCIWP